MSSATSGAAEVSSPWLFSKAFDLALFGGSLALSLGLLLIGSALGLLDGDAPTWVWVVGVLGVDVAHVWSTGWRVLWDTEERHARSGQLVGVALSAYVVLVVCHSISKGLFWTVLAYVAVFHFIRQQRGFVALYARKSGPSLPWERSLDGLAVYAATLWPVIYWHAHLPRRFSWLIEGDFVRGMPAVLASVSFPFYVMVGLAYVAKEAWRWKSDLQVSAGKNLVMLSTWLMWGIGLVVLNSDYAFTVTNIFIHGIPYLGLIWAYGRHRARTTSVPTWQPFSATGLPIFLGVVVLLAWIEEWGWDRWVWHEQSSLFPGPAFVLPAEALSLIVPLLALPQATHYILDGFIWKSGPDNRGVVEALGLTPRIAQADQGQTEQG
ncbi:MAG: hypothetical protein ABI672_01010 [Vicinamibacteria bacterium]